MRYPQYAAPMPLEAANEEILKIQPCETDIFKRVRAVEFLIYRSEFRIPGRIKRFLNFFQIIFLWFEFFEVNILIKLFECLQVSDDRPQRHTPFFCYCFKRETVFNEFASFLLSRDSLSRPFFLFGGNFVLSDLFLVRG